jgi:hypothetical protein
MWLMVIGVEGPAGQTSFAENARQPSDPPQSRPSGNLTRAKWANYDNVCGCVKRARLRRDGVPIEARGAWRLRRRRAPPSQLADQVHVFRNIRAI